MLGAIVGDVVGSIYEFNNIKTKNFPFFSSECRFTDDTVMTVAVADAIMKGGNEDNFIESVVHFGSLYPDAGYGAKFKEWLKAKVKKPYDSYGNGSAMRVSPCAWVLPPSDSDRDIGEVESLARVSASFSHSHPEGVKGAVAVAYSIYLMRFASSIGKVDAYKSFLKDRMTKRFGYNMEVSLLEIRPKYRFNSTCSGTVPQAIIAFLESSDFEDAIRNAISLGGDSDTLAAITGSIAEAAYGIPQHIINDVYSFLDKNLKVVIEEFRNKYVLG